MSSSTKPTSQDTHLEEVFGAPLARLYAAAAAGTATPAEQRALELRSFLALAEEQVAHVRDRVHQYTAPDADMSTLSASELRLDSQWMDAALSARTQYVTALDQLLRSMPPPGSPRPESRVRFNQPKITTRAAPRVPPLAAAPAAHGARGH
ncbi:hypothetical protein GCM10010425_59020 [Streptomyces spororaveus]|uniref:Uncharacterized protein n=1 Tax=Streptomyces spororaveus TaxID=284039 RepID=A0ABQ3T755_9ACTN|nr:hypothetical protein [Streptomyces spororaveus]GHI76227.1 hypothetical protein Sspor_17880 [Streptomyces spororaveus]